MKTSDLSRLRTIAAKAAAEPVVERSPDVPGLTRSPDLAAGDPGAAVTETPGEPRRADMAHEDLALLGQPALDLVVVIPTFCERGNVPELVKRLRRSLAHLQWEAIFVDDDSPDGTADAVRALSRMDRRVRCLQRIGRRGLSSACIEGMLASSAPVIAIMDADLQHDETKLPAMFQRLRDENADLVIATRYAGTGSVGSWDAGRVGMSRAATRLSRFVQEQKVSDPMSGFFMMKREVLEESVRDLSAVGFKLLLDILATVKRPIRIAEEPYTFGLRTSGESKLDSVVMWDFGLLLLDKLIGRYVPMRFVAFSIVGAAGVLVHMSIAGLLLHTGRVNFPASQAIAATVTMIFNYSVNNVLTYRDQRKKGVAWFAGLLSFMAACSLGGLANVGLAAWLFSQGIPWFAAALAGIVVGAVWNYAMTSRYTWGKSGAHQ